MEALSNPFSFTLKVDFISQRDAENGYPESKQMFGIRRKEILEGNATLEMAMARKEVRTTKALFNTYSVSKTI